MANHAVLFFLLVVEVFLKGLTDVIQTQQHVMVKVGEDAHVSCQLMQTKDVLQVTWQKDLPEGKKNIGSFNKYFGQTVNPGFKGKLEFKDAGLKNCSIVIRKVMEQDEGCYCCLFNTYPDGSLTGRTCLYIYELHEPILQIGESNSSEETVVSCSATGHPAPTVTLNVPQQDLYFSNSSTVSVTNTNATVTVTTTAVLSGGFHGNGAQVGCVVRLLTVPEIQVFKTIPAVKQSSDDGFDDESGSDKNFILIVALVTPMVIVCVAAVIIAIIFLLKHKHKKRLSHRDAEKSKTPRKPTKEAYESKTPLMEKENPEIILQSSGTNPKGEKPKLQDIAINLSFETQTMDTEKIKIPQTLNDKCTTPLMNKENQQIRQRSTVKKTAKQKKPKASPSASKRLML